MSAAPAATCSVEGCARPHSARGFCRTHYEGARRRGEVMPRSRRLTGTPAPECSVEGCEQDARSRGLCHRHYVSAVRHGDIEVRAIGSKAAHPPCEVEGCDRAFYAKGLCQGHYRAALNAARRVERARARAERELLNPPPPPPPPPPQPDLFVVTAPWERGMSEARQRRRVVEQVARLPEVEGLRFRGDWSWRVVPGPRGRPVELIGTVRASSPEFPAPDPERTPHRWTAALSTSTSTTPRSSALLKASR